MDGPVVGEKEIGDPLEPIERVRVFVRDGLVAAVAARHHQRRPGLAQQQMMQRRVRQHDAEQRIARGH